VVRLGLKLYLVLGRGKEEGGREEGRRKEEGGRRKGGGHEKRSRTAGH